MLNELYQKTLKLAAHKRSNTYLAILSFTESSFFPIPPDVMIAPMVIAKKNDYLKIFLIATILSLYHLGIEQGFIQESLLCDLEKGANILDKDEILKQLQQKNISFKDVTFKIF